MNRILTYISLSLLLALGMGACNDDFKYPGSYDGEGEAQVAVNIKFEPLVQTDVDTRSAGDLIKTINNLSILVYNHNKELVMNHYMTPADNGWNITMPDGVDGDQSETRTPEVSFTLPEPLPYGSYYCYAVANMEPFDDEEAADINNLKNIKLTWNSGNIAANNAMFGYFTPEKNTVNASEGFDAPMLTLNRPDMTIHSWIKRAASKVTIAYDGSGLHQDVWVYIKDVTIRDIPKECFLGKDNKPGSDSELLNPYDALSASLPASSLLSYGTDGSVKEGQNSETNWENWMAIAKGSGTKGTPDHTETDQALYFFENMQGDFRDVPNKDFYDKTPNPDKVGDAITSPEEEDFKDGVPYGTYIEVTGYYVSNNPQNTTRGPIKYRFMLGRDTKYNYNAQRNHHYKLTLGFKGWANQPDWHIEYYEQEPGLYVPDEFFVSYLYNQKHSLPIKIVGDCTSLKMEIIENNWAPYDPTTSDQVPPATVGSGDNAFKWNKTAWQTYNGKNHPYLGFLALTVPVNDGLPPKNIITDKIYSTSGAFDALKSYYEGKGEGNTVSQAVRSFNSSQLNPGTYNKGHNGWEVKKLDDQSKMLTVQLITRNKTMIAISGFTGNNPYDSYQRKAVVRVTATFKGVAKPIVREFPVYQVRRIVNPKGVWRRWNRTEDFNVHLMRLAKPTDTQFTSFNSEGSWKAFVEVKNGDFISLVGSNGSSGIGAGDTIYGDTDTPIDFDIKFKGVGDNSSSCAVVRVEYHGNKCIHKVMVRQGYLTPLSVVKGGTKWSSFNLYKCTDASTAVTNSSSTAAVLTQNPLAFGSYFKRLNLRDGILESNNDTWGIMVDPGALSLTTGKTAKWTDISTPNTTSTTRGWGKLTSKVNNQNRNYRLPTYADFQALDDAEFGFGVLYGDGATVTAKTVDEAYGYDQGSNNVTTSTKGTRGVIVYSRDDAAQIFFPMGKKGMGRRTQFNTGGKAHHGYLRYGDVYNPLTGDGNLTRPIPYNLPYSTGAIYWIDKIETDGHIEANSKSNTAGWDMNYFSFDFGSYTSNNINDACPIRLVIDESNRY